MGTPEYISPEVLTSLDRTADYGVCCDWWSLGIIAYELLYETTPFEGDSTSKTYNNIMSYKVGGVGTYVGEGGVDGEGRVGGRKVGNKLQWRQ